MTSGSGDQVDDVLLDLFGDIDVFDQLLDGEQFLQGDHLLQILNGMLILLRSEDIQFVLRLRIAHLDAYQEAIQLSFRQGKVPSYSIGFCVAMMRNGLLRR